VTAPETAHAVDYAAHRVKAFMDAVVAIAMTLLILPLMDSIGEVASKHEGAEEWIVGHIPQLVAFVLSFVIIAMFWMNHHRLFAHVERVSNPLLWIMMAWLLSIVWLPVVTAMTGQMEPSALLIGMYIGSMLLTSLLNLATRLYLRAHPQLHDIDGVQMVGGMAADLAMIVLFAASLAIGLIAPDSIGYYGLFLMFLTGPVQRLFRRMLRTKTA